VGTNGYKLELLEARGASAKTAFHGVGLFVFGTVKVSQSVGSLKPIEATNSAK
jgi:hypothetical protein